MGLEILHLRKPGFANKQMEELLTGIKKRYLSRIMLHTHHELVSEYGLRGCHFPTDLRENPGSPVLTERCSTSCHSVAELRQLQASFEYYFISPVFDSISKPSYKAGIDKSDLIRASTTLQTNIVALGGIDHSTLPQVPGECWGVAILGAIWKERKMSKRLESFQQLQKIVNTL